MSVTCRQRWPKIWDAMRIQKYDEVKVAKLSSGEIAALAGALGHVQKHVLLIASTLQIKHPDYTSTFKFKLARGKGDKRGKQQTPFQI